MKRLLILILVMFLLAGCGGEAVQPGPDAPTADDDKIEEPPSQEEDVDESSGVPVLMPDTSGLEGLPISEFFETSFNMLLARDPEGLLELGMYEGPPVLTDISATALAEEHQLTLQLLDLLHGYDFEALSEEDQISYMVFEYFLEREIQLYQDRHFVYLVNSMAVRSKPQLYIMFFTDSHPMASAQDAEDYVARVRLLDEKIDQLIERIEESAEAGIIAPRIVLDYGRTEVKNYLGRSPQTSSLLRTFRDKTAVLSSLDPEKRNQLDGELMAALEDEVFPAFGRLDDLLEELIEQAPGTVGLYAFQGGDEVYQHTLERFTTTGLTADEIHEQGMGEVARIEAEMRTRFEELGYPEDERIPELYQRLTNDSGTLLGDEVTAEYERILAEAEANLGEYFEIPVASPIEVVGGPVGGFYSPGAMDGSRPGRFYAQITSPVSIYNMKSLAYHEGIPGHHYQITTAATVELPFFRNIVSFTGYVEGWALYSEYVAAEMGWYKGDPYGDLGRLQYEMLRACRMVVDTGIHAKGWSFDQAADYMYEYSGFSRGFVEYQIMRYISYPGHSTAYLVGKIELMRIRSEAEAALGADFDLREFHTNVLSNGSMPIEVLERVVEDWVGSK